MCTIGHINQLKALASKWPGYATVADAYLKR